MSERESLETHVDLCQLRYSQLEARIGKIEEKLDMISNEILEQKRSLASVIIGASGTVVVALIGLITTILVKF